MRFKITKSARRFGYIIWNAKLDAELKCLIKNNDEVEIAINQISLGIKKIDWDYHRVYIGTKITRGFALDQTYYRLSYANGRLNVTTDGGC